jgi:TetR/AcrR family transcriptional regulator, transcriptional repressor for nem operon
MRYGDQHKTKTHGRIVREAGRLFREQGFKGTGVDAVMNAAGLTPGGFYAHFRGKDELLAETLLDCSAEMSKSMSSKVAASSEPLRAWVDRYLSELHRDHPASGCPLPTLAAEVSRQSRAVRKAFTASLAEYIATLSKLVPAEIDAARIDAAIAMLASMVGGMLLARAVDDKDLSARILRVARDAAAPDTGESNSPPPVAARPRSKSVGRKK